MKTITFYSYKGGVGRTLALSNIAKRLNEFGKKVFIIDFDLEAPGLHYKFRDFLDKDMVKKGLVDYIYEFSQNRRIDPNIEDYVKSFKINNKTKSKINLMCAGDSSSSSYWKKLSAITWNDMFYKEESEGFEFFLNLKHTIKEKYNPDFLLIDSRTGFTETSAITMSILADEVMVFSINNLENVEGSKQILKSLNRTQSLTNQQIKTHFVLTRIPEGNTVEDKTLQKNIIKRVDYQLNSDCVKDKKLVETIYTIQRDRDLEIEESFKIGADYKPDAISISNDYFKILKVIGDFTGKEIDHYNSILESDRIFQKALSLPEGEIYLNQLKEALKLNKTNIEIMIRLSAYYSKNLYVQEQISILKKALEIQPNDSFILVNLGAAMAQMGVLKKDLETGQAGLNYIQRATELDKQYKILTLYELYHYALSRRLEVISDVETLKDYFELLDKFPESHEVYNCIAVLYQEMGDFNNAYEYIYKALDQDSSNALYKTTLAEIHARKGKMSEFYYNIDLSLKAGYDVSGFFYYDEFYSKYFTDPRFLEILDRHNQYERFRKLMNRYVQLVGN